MWFFMCFCFFVCFRVTYENFSQKVIENWLKVAGIVKSSQDFKNDRIRIAEQIISKENVLKNFIFMFYVFLCVFGVTLWKCSVQSYWKID